MFKTLIKGLVLVGLAFFISACGKPAKTIAFAGNTMGTTYHIKFVAGEQSPHEQLLQAEIDLALEAINELMSTYRAKSELSRFNRMPMTSKMDVSHDTADVIYAGIELYHKTDGALDITLGPLVNLWGFGPDMRPIQIPTPEEIAEAKAKTGVNHLFVDRRTLSKNMNELYVDLSSIAKGFAVDKVAMILAKYQPKGYLVEIGGEVSVYGVKADNTAWRIAIEQPDTGARSVQQVIEPGNMAMATSGDYRNYYEEDGQRFTHIIDPRSGYPVKHKLASVTVLHPETMVADGYATAMMVLGTEASLALANKENLAVMLIEKQDEGFKVYYSDAFKPFMGM